MLVAMQRRGYPSSLLAGLRVGCAALATNSTTEKATNRLYVTHCEGLRTPAMTTPAPRADSRRRQSANGRNRERWASTVRRVLRGFDVGTDADEYRWIDARRG